MDRQGRGEDGSSTDRRMPGDDPYHDPVAAMMDALRRAGWSLGHVTLARPDGSSSCLVSGHDGEDLIRVEGPTQSEAWRMATDQARSLGMLGR